ncbi:MAG TPA: AAA family ATPase [Thermoanaerobaculia bacterium]|nr:AAA family ATPase [Thermoanaerobaculia bacterium]
MLTRLRVQGFKSLHDVDIQLAPLVVLMGPNAAGKSNLLEALLLLSRLATEQTLAAAFEPPLRGYPLEAFSLPEKGLEGLLQQERAELSLEAEVQPARASKKAVPEPLLYRVGLRIQPKTGTLEVSDEYLVRLKKDKTPKQKPRIENYGESLIVRQLGESGAPRHEPLGLNHTLVSNRQFTGEHRYPDFDRLRSELSAWQTYYLDPRIAMREPQPPREVTDIGARGEWIAPFLYRLKESEKERKFFLAIGRALRSAIPTVEDLDVDLDPRRGILDILIKQDGTPYSSRVVSEGTLRVLALCCLAGNPWPGELIAFEEPENGVHPRRIEVVADLLASIAEQRRSQVVVTTHSPTLIAAMLQRAAVAPDLVKLFRCSQRGRATRVQEFVPTGPTGPLFADEEVRSSLTGPEDAALVEAMLLRGWLDG